MVRDVVLDEKTFNEEFRAEFLGHLDDVKFQPAKEVLSEIGLKSSSSRIKASVKRVLEANFASVKKI